MEVRRIHPDEMEAYREVRLRALRLAPYAFSTTFADASSRDDDAWRVNTARLSGERVAGFALDRGDGTFGGLVSVTIEDPVAAEVNQMWLDDDLRGGAWGAALLSACESFAAAGGVDRLTLWAAAANERALRFYRRSGYLDTGGLSSMRTWGSRLSSRSTSTEPGSRGSPERRGLGEWYARSRSAGGLAHPRQGVHLSPLTTMSGGLFPFSPRAHRAHEIPWREWDVPAFEDAHDTDRPILLSVVATWSTASHEMDEGAYSDPRVIDLLSEQFTSVRVDADERPDVAARYAPQTPTVAFLTPEGDPIRTDGPLDSDALVHAARAVLDEWYRDREAVTQRVEASRAMRAAERAAARATRAPGALTPAILDIALGIVDQRWVEDPPGLVEDDGTVGHHPHADVLRLLRYAYHRRGLVPEFNRGFALAQGLAQGGLYDRVDGGFFRYATQEGWGEPISEKLARTQGAMLLALAEVAQSDEEARYVLQEVIEGTATYLVGALGDASGAIVNAEVTAPGAMEVDRRVFSGAAAVVARGLLQAGLLLDRRDWVTSGRRVVDFLLSRMRAGEAGMYHAWDGSPRTLGVLDDQAQVLLALLEAYEITGQAHYFEQARQIARVVDRDWHEPGLGFRDIAEGGDETGLLGEPLYPMDTNADMAEALTWLGRLTHDERHLAQAQVTLGAFAPGLEKRGLGGANYARVVDRLLSAEPEFKIVSEYEAGEPDMVADPLHAAALRLRLPGRTVQRLDRVGDATLIEQLRLPDVAKVAYVCSGSTCLGPFTEPEQLMPAVEELLGAPVW